MPYPKIILYGSKTSPCVNRVMILLEELKLNYKLREIDLTGGEQMSPDFAELNPFKKVPVLRYQESKDSLEKLLFESRSILRFLANKHDTDVDYYPDSKCDMWLEIESQELNPIIRTTDVDLKQLEPILAIYNKHLTDNKYMNGDDFTIADIASIPCLNAFIKNNPKHKEYLKKFPKVYNWLKKIKSRDSVQKVLK